MAFGSLSSGAAATGPPGGTGCRRTTLRPSRPCCRCRSAPRHRRDRPAPRRTRGGNRRSTLRDNDCHLPTPAAPLATTIIRTRRVYGCSITVPTGIVLAQTYWSSAYGNCAPREFFRHVEDGALDQRQTRLVAVEREQQAHRRVLLRGNAVVRAFDQRARLPAPVDDRRAADVEFRELSEAAGGTDGVRVQHDDAVDIGERVVGELLAVGQPDGLPARRQAGARPGGRERRGQRRRLEARLRG